ncbi:hypothetical protein PV08_08687 [Exophiala spinifera]|uniref:Uncharacterized protein n=1 Tax=Exophiala spinifera TaxID=91928 RepID=A0A0D2BQU4_9EURO|nr:uncharacterized protein PV08_08687 [Exophiala spinifera]KIW13499.1 hypothetical protein PV08_08687 [Exophiala spinifera]
MAASDAVLLAQHHSSGRGSGLHRHHHCTRQNLRIQNGIVDVPDPTLSGFVGSYVVGKNYSLLWTSLPSFLFSIYALVWTALVDDSANRQPYIELRRGAGALQTIMLDYRSMPGWKNWYVAFRNRHGHLATGFLLAFSLSTLFQSLAAHLLVGRTAQFSTQVPVTFTSEFNASAIDAKTNLQPFIDISTAIRAYNSTPPTWMTDTYAFERFAVPGGLDGGNITVNASAYSAVLQCNSIDAVDYTVSVTNSDSSGDQTLQIDFSDRGCAVSQRFLVNSGTPIYAKAWYDFCSNSNIRRFGMSAGQYSASADSHLRDFSVISCIPTYWLINGSLTMSSADGASLTSIVSFVGSSQQQIDPGVQITFENSLHMYTFFNPAAATNADSVGFSIYSAAQARSGQSSPNASVVQQSTQNFYATAYAALVKNILLQTSSSPRTGVGSVTRTTPRLFIVGEVAWVMVAAMVVVLFCHANLIVYAKRHDTMLDEDPVGLLGAAKLLRRSEVLQMVDDFEELHPDVPGMQDYMKKHYGLGRGDHCWWDDEERRIKAVGMMGN